MAQQAIQAASELLIDSTVSHDGSARRTAEHDGRVMDSGERFSRVPETSEWTALEPRSPWPPQGNGEKHSLPDYQMQLLLVEQQNKKRRMMAQAEQIALSKNPAISARDPVLEAPSSRSSILIVADDGEEVVAAARETDERLDGFRSLQEPDIEREARNAKRRRTTTPKPVKSNRSIVASGVETQAQLNGNSLPHFGMQSTESQRTVGPSRPLHAVIYRVSCDGNLPRNWKMYQDVPQRHYEYHPIRGQHQHPRGSSPVQDLAHFIASTPDLAYLVFRDIRCEDDMRWDFSRQSTPSPKSGLGFKESIAIIDTGLRSFVDGIARCAPNSSAYFTESQVSTSNHGLQQDHSERDLYEERFFCHHRKALAASAPNLSSPLREQAMDLLAFLKNEHGAMYSEADELCSRGLIHRDRLEMLFCPNDVLITRDFGLLSAFVLRSWPSGHSTLTLDCWNWGFDGQWLRRKRTLKTLARPLNDVVRIQDLAIYPLRHASEEDICKLQARGQKFWDLRHKNVASYGGCDLKAEQNYSNEERCIIDYRTYRRFLPQAEAFQFSDKPIAPFDRWPESIPHNAVLDKSLIILLPPFIHGIRLKKKQWVKLVVDDVRPVTWNKDVFERLVLPKKTKDLVKALIMVRTSKLGEQQGMSIAEKRNRDNLIAGRGNGLILLLHGGPGTGKTLTAESVAELAALPLYKVTCSDLGTNVDAVQKQLQKILDLGEAWNCVLLLDEADVFLEQQSLSNMEKNNLVSVFLRTLEDYDGIVILTSNRVGTFNEAFKSRIQVALHYTNLDRFARKKIWKNFFDSMDADQDDVNLEDLNKHMQELADQVMNGWEIRNALTTARQIALFQKETLAWEHVEQAITTTSIFNKYLETVNGNTDEQSARDQEIR